MHKKNLIKQTIHLGASTLVSKLLGLGREIVRARYLGAGALGDAFLTAFRLPYSLYKIFAEGAVSAAFIPFAVQIIKDDNYTSINKLVTLMLIIMQTFFLLVCMLSWAFPATFIWFVSPGWLSNPTEPSQAIGQAQHLLPVLMLSIFFLSASSFLSGALQVIHNFFVTNLQPLIMNILLIGEFIICRLYSIPLQGLAAMYVFNGIFIFIMSGLLYLRYFAFEWPFDKETWQNARQLGKRLLSCFISLGILEINTFVDVQFASFLPEGSISLFSYSSAFMRVPLSIFAIAFATISLPYFSRVGSNSPRRLSFHLLEAAKALLWITVPAMLLMIFFSYEIFSTVLRGTFSTVQSQQAGHLLIASSVGLFFFSMNRILMNIYYILHKTSFLTYISLATVVLNILLNYLLFIPFKAVGIVAATSGAGALQMCLFLFFLQRVFNFTIYLKRFGRFSVLFIKQLVCVLLLFYGIYTLLYLLFENLPRILALFFTQQIGLWLWVAPLSLLLMYVLWITRKQFGIKIYYFN